MAGETLTKDDEVRRREQVNVLAENRRRLAELSMEGHGESQQAQELGEKVRSLEGGMSEEMALVAGLKAATDLLANIISRG